VLITLDIFVLDKLSSGHQNILKRHGKISS
jgi:hypothetical protein